jgi:hypothetical protein
VLDAGVRAAHGLREIRREAPSALTHTRLLFTMHEPIEGKVRLVVDMMLDLGPPRIRAVDLGDCVAAIEGCTRIEAAQLGYPVNLECLADEDQVPGESLDWADLDWGVNYSAGWLGREIPSLRSPAYELEDDGRVHRIPAPTTHPRFRGVAR